MAESVWGDGSEGEDIKRLGGLPVVRAVMRRLGIREVVDRLCPIRNVADYTHGQIVEVLIANRLVSPRPLYQVAGWASEWAVPGLFGVASEKLNDDRLARTLDAVAEQIATIQGTVTAAAVVGYGLQLDQLHLDVTSFMFEGRYDDTADGDFPKPARGYNPEKDTRRKQVRTGLGVSKDGGVPLFHQGFDGNRNDSKALLELLHSMQTHLCDAGVPVNEVLVVGDSKLLAAGNLRKLLCQETLHFVGPAERGADFDEEVLKLDRDAWTEQEYASESELLRRKKAAPDTWNRFWTQEREWKITDSQGTEHTLRKVFVRSSEEQKAARRSRERQLKLASEDLQRVRNGIPRYYKTEEKLRAKVHDVLRDRRVTAILKVEIGSQDGRPTLAWAIDDTAVQREERIRGHYVLLTNLPTTKSANEVLTIHKDQYRVEQRFSHWKGPLGIAPIFLKDNRRIAALVLLTALALQVFCLIEREVRKKLGDEQGYARGFLPGNIRSRPTGTTIFDLLNRTALAVVDLVTGRIQRALKVRGTIADVYGAFDVQPQTLTES